MASQSSTELVPYYDPIWRTLLNANECWWPVEGHPELRTISNSWRWFDLELNAIENMSLSPELKQRLLSDAFQDLFSHLARQNVLDDPSSDVPDSRRTRTPHPCKCTIGVIGPATHFCSCDMTSEDLGALVRLYWNIDCGVGNFYRFGHIYEAPGRIPRDYIPRRVLPDLFYTHVKDMEATFVECCARIVPGSRTFCSTCHQTQRSLCAHELPEIAARHLIEWVRYEAARLSVDPQVAIFNIVEGQADMEELQRGDAFQRCDDCKSDPLVAPYAICMCQPDATFMTRVKNATLWRDIDEVRDMRSMATDIFE